MIRPEAASDAEEVRRLLALAFGPDHAARNIWKLRDGPPQAELCLVDEDAEGRLAGSIRYWPVTIASVPSILLGPLAVDPAVKGRGIGRGLVAESLAIAHRDGRWRWCFVSGEPGYYTNLGFTKIGEGDMDLPGPIEDERLHLLDFSGKTPGEYGLRDMPERPWAVRPAPSA